MSTINSINLTHIEKLGHKLGEIRLRALENIISKLDDGFTYSCKQTEKEFIKKLFFWFNFDSLPCSPGKILDLIQQLINTNQININDFGAIEFKKKLSTLSSRLDPSWTPKINEIECAVLNQVISNQNGQAPIPESQEYQGSTRKLTAHFERTTTTTEDNTIGNNQAFHEDINADKYIFNDDDSQINDSNQCHQSSDIFQELDLTLPETHQNGSFTSGISAPVMSKKTDGAIRWLLFPWQPLVSSDYGVLSAVEEALNTNINANTNAIIRTCQFITNVMLQDFPAEVFLQRPSIVMILQAFLQQSYGASKNDEGGNSADASSSIIPMVLRTLYKLTRALRFRIFYYCDASVVNGRQKDVGKKDVNSSCNSGDHQDDHDDNDDEVKAVEDASPKINYNAPSYQQPIVNAVNGIIIDNESVLQSQQMLIPYFCTETLAHVLKILLNSQLETYSHRPLKDIKIITDVMWELLQLLTTSVSPSIWMCSDELSLKIHEDLKTLMELFGNVLQYFGNFHTTDHCRVTYLLITCMTLKLLCSMVPLELADYIIPTNLKISVSVALMDAPIYSIYSELNAIMQEYARNFRGPAELEYVKLFEEMCLITDSMRAAIGLLKRESIDVNVNTLKRMYASISCLVYHKNCSIVKKYFNLLVNSYKIELTEAEELICTKLTLCLLAHGDKQVRAAAYEECHFLVASVMLGVDTVQEVRDKKYGSSMTPTNCLLFLCNTSVLTEIICHGINDDGDDGKVKALAEDIMIYLLKGKIQMQEKIWFKFIEALLPSLSLLQCHAEMKTSLGQCISKMLDPDISLDIQLPYIDVIKGNMRFLFSLDSAIRDEGACRLIYLLGLEKNATEKLPRVSSLHGLPLASLLFTHIDKTRQAFIYSKLDGKYPINSLLSIIELLKFPSDVEPKIRKSALVQLSVMLTDASLHSTFLSENGLAFLLDIFDKALVEKDYENYPDSVVPIVTILKLITLTQSAVRHELSNHQELLINVIRSVFLFPNNQCLKSDASIFLFLLLFDDQVILVKSSKPENDRINDGCHRILDISLPNLVLRKMQSPFVCRTHWKNSANRKSNKSMAHFSNPISLVFLRQFWAWHWNARESGDNLLLISPEENLNSPEIAEKLMIRDAEVAYLKNTSITHCCQRQLMNIQSSTAHHQVTCALDYLWMYIKYHSRVEHFVKPEKLTSIPWEKVFQRFLLSNPTNKEDGHLYVDILNFLNILISKTRDVSLISWLSRIIKNIAKSLSDIVENFDLQNQDIHQSTLKLVRSLRCNNYDCKSLDSFHDNAEKNQQQSDNMWNILIQLLISNLCFSDQQQQQQHQQHLEQQQHFYNLVYLDWLLTCLIHLTSRCQWDCPRDLLSSLGNALIELITSFHGNGAVSFMGLSITRNSIICLNHFIHYMRINMSKPRDWTLYWYQHEGRTLSWIPILLRNRDPLIRASALQLLGGLIKAPHTAQQLLGALVMAPTELVQTLLQFIVNREECSLVKEHACIALSNLIKNSVNSVFEYVDSLASNAILIYMEQMNIFYEINLLCCNIYMFSSIDPTESSIKSLENSKQSGSVNGKTATQKLLSLPKTVLHLYNCHDELMMLTTTMSSASFSSAKDNSLETNSFAQFLATASLITSVCNLLNNLVLIGEFESINKIYEHSLDKYLVRCFGPIPKYNMKCERNMKQYCDVIELYASICILLTNCIVNSKNFARVVSFSPDILCVLLNYLNNDHLAYESSKFVHLRDKLWTAVFSFLSVLSLTENQNTEALKTAIELVGLNMIIKPIRDAINQRQEIELRMSGVACLAFLLSQEIASQENANEYEIEGENGANEEEDDDRNGKNAIGSNDYLSLGTVLDSMLILRLSNGNSDDLPGDNESREGNDRSELEVSVGSEICHNLIKLLIVYNYASKSGNDASRIKDKNLIMGALANLLSVSNEAKKTAVEENLVGTSVLILKEIYTELNLQPYSSFQRMGSGRDKKSCALLNDTNRVMLLLMNFAYNNRMVKCTLSQSGLADMLHKLWAWILLNDSTLLLSLKLMATFTTNCPEGAQSLTLTTTIWPSVSLRKTPNTVSMIHVIIQLIIKEINKAESQAFNIQRLHLAFNVLRNAVHAYDCRVSIAKSILLDFFTKIHPSTTKRTKSWLVVEVCCLEFLIDFTFYDEGQTSVSKATDALEVLIQLAGCSTPATRILALSTLRNLLFNTSNRPRLISSVEFINLLHRTFKAGSLCEIGIAGSMLWSLVANNQKGKLMARTSGLSSCLQEVLGRLTLMPDKKQQDISNMIQYVIKITTSDS